MGDTIKPSSKTTYESGKTTSVVEVTSGNIKTAIEVSNDAQGTLAVKEKVEFKLPKLTIGGSVKNSSNSITGESGSTFEAELARKVESDVGGGKWTAKAAITVTYDESDKTTALDPGISLVKTSLSSSLKLTGTVSYGAIEGKAEGNAVSIGAANVELKKFESSNSLLSSTVGTISVFGQNLGANLLQMKPAEFAAAQARTETMAESVKLNMDQMAKGSPAYQVAASQLAGLEQSKINLKTAEVFTLAETAETAIRNNTGEWTKITVDGGRTVMWEKSDGTKLMSDRGAERVILVRSDGSGEAFSYTNPKGAPSESFQFASGAATQVKLMADGMVQVTDGTQQLFGLGTNGLAMSDASIGTQQGTSWVWQLNEAGKYERQYVEGVIRIEGVGPVGASTNTVEQAKLQLADQQREVAKDAFTRSEIEYRNQNEAASTNVRIGKAPDGSVLGKMQRNEDGSSVVWTRDPATGDLIRVSTSGSGNSLVAVEHHYDGKTGEPKGGIIYQGDGKGGFNKMPFGGMSPRADAGGAGDTAPVVADSAMGYTTQVNLPFVEINGQAYQFDAQSGTYQRNLGAGQVDAIDPETGQRFLVNHQAQTVEPLGPEQSIVLNDGGVASVTSTRVSQPTNPSSADAVNGADHQSDNYLNKIDLPLPQLASLFGAGQVGNLDILPFNDSSSFLTNADGDIAGEMTKLSNGYYQVKDLGGNAVYVSGKDGSVLSQTQYDQSLLTSSHPNGGDSASFSFYGADFGGYLDGYLDGYAAFDGYADFAAYGYGNNALSDGDFFDGDLFGNWEAGATGFSDEAWFNDFDGGAGFGVSAGSYDFGDGAEAFDGGGGDQGIQSQNGSAGEAFPRSGGGGGGGGGAPAYRQPQGDHSRYVWDAQGQIVPQLQGPVVQGGQAVLDAAAEILHMLQSRLDQQNQQSGHAWDDPNRLVINPAQMPGIAVLDGRIYVEFTQDGIAHSHAVPPDQLLPFVAGIMAQQHALVTAWQADTLRAHGQLDLADAGGTTVDADALHQSYNVLSAELAPALLAKLAALTPARDAQATLLAAQDDVPLSSDERLVDVDGDGYLERTQWLAANQAMLVVDTQADGRIAGAQDAVARGLGANGLDWMDVDGNQLLDARDPAFPALKLWLDVNADGQAQTQETISLQESGLLAIDFALGQMVWADGSRTALTAQALRADTAGVRLTELRNVDSALQAGAIIEHEGVAGQPATLGKHFAQRTGDWEGTAQQAAHRHGGGNVAGSPVQTSATGVISTGPISGTAQRMASTSSTVEVGDIRLKSALLAFVPAGAGSAQQAQREATAAMIRSADSSLFGGGNGALPLVALALGAGAVQWPTVAGAESLDTVPDVMLPAQVPASVAMPAPLTLSIPPTPQLAMGFVWSGAELTPVDLPVFQVGRVVTDVQPALGAVPGEAMPPSTSDATPETQPWAYLVPTQVGQAEDVPVAPTGGDMVLDYPKVMGEKVLGTEDTGLLMSQALLLSNDSSVNESALHISAVSGSLHGSVGLRTNSSGGVEVVFIPEANYHGLASFDYAVTDQYGLSSTATATLLIAAVNDAPATQGEQASGVEDATLMFNAMDLLANDHDVDTAVDGDVLRITRVGLAAHGQVFLQADGMVRFVPDADYNGPAQFSYWVGDRDAAGMAAGTGLETQASVSLTILPVNDLPVATGEQIDSDEDVALLISPALLLANDSDVDTVTNGQVLAITAVGAAQHGTVALLPDGTIRFLPEPDYFGAASFSYTVNDGAGGTATALAVVNLAPANDAPVAAGESMNSDEDQVLTFTAAALLQNDQDIDSPHAELVIARVGEAEHGTVQLNAQGQVVFTPEVDYSGPASFAYWVADAQGLEAKATTVLTIAPVNDAPGVAGEIVTGASEDASLVIAPSDLLANDSDVDDAHSQLKVSWVGNALGGTVALDAAGLVVFTPAPDFNGNAHFDYRVADAAGAESVAATAWVPVAAVNDNPVGVDDQFTTNTGSQMFIAAAQLLGNDRDVDGDALTVAGVRNAVNGTVWMNGADVRFDPAAGFIGPASFDYLTSDGQGGQAWATAYVNVVTNHQAPSITGAWVDLVQSSRPQVYVLGFTATDPDGTAVAISIASQPGTLFPMQPMASHPGYFLYQDNAASGAIKPFSLQLTDGNGDVTIVQVSLPHAPYMGERLSNSVISHAVAPVTLDLDGNGLDYVGLNDSRAFFDVDNDGSREHLAWVAPDDALLARDIGGDKVINRIDEISFTGYLAGAKTDLEGLAAFDSNGNHLLDAGDDKWKEFGAWQDKNGNGISDAGEFKTLDEIGITQIGLQSDQQIRQTAQGVTELGQSSLTWADGRTGAVGDVIFAVDGTQRPPSASPAPAVEAPATAVPTGSFISDAPPVPADLRTDAQIAQDASDAQLMRMALLFNQMANTADPEAHAPLGFVLIAPDTQWHDLALIAAQNAQLQTPGV